MSRLVYPKGTSPAVADKLNRADDAIQQRVRAELDFDRKIDAERVANRTEASQLFDNLSDLEERIAQAEREVRLSGVPYSKTVETKDADGRTRQELVPTGYIENLKAERDAIRAERRHILDRKVPKKITNFVFDAVAENIQVQLIVDNSPVTIERGPNLLDSYKAAFAVVVAKEKALHDAIAAPLDVEEGVALAMKRIDSLAQPPGCGGFIRGTFTNERGEIVLGPMPRADFAWPYSILAENVEIPDSLRILAWLMKSQLKAAITDEMRRNWNKPGSMTLAAKQAAKSALEAELWQERRICEELFRACRDSGIRVNRPRDTPAAIILGIVPFNLARNAKPAAAPVEDDDHGTDAFEGADDFETEAAE